MKGKKKNQMTPEDLIKQLKVQNLKITPIVEFQNACNKNFIACDCSGCNNHDTVFTIC